MIKQLNIYDKSKQYWYICPRYWCLKTNTSMTEKEVKEGKCGGKIIPKDAQKHQKMHLYMNFQVKNIMIKMVIIFNTIQGL